MTCEEYLSNMKPGYIVDGGSEEHLVMHELSQRALKITMELNNKYHTKEEIIQLMSELTGQKIDESFGMFKHSKTFIYFLSGKFRHKLYNFFFCMIFVIQLHRYL